LLVDVPYGAEASVFFGGNEYHVSGGTYTYSADDKEG
jgi:hypothetical protein